MQRISTLRKQKGAALVVGIVLLVVSTLLALVAMKSSTFQERMASNQHNKTISLMAAEYGIGELLRTVTSVGYDSTQGLAQWGVNVVGSEGAPVNAGTQGGFYWVEILNHIDRTNDDTDPTVALDDPGAPLRLAVHGVGRNQAGGDNLGRTQLHLEMDILTFPPGGGESDDAAINFIHAIEEYRAPNSNSFTVTGAQEEGAPTGPAIGVSSTNDRDALIGELGPDGVDRLDNYDGGIVAKEFGDFWDNEHYDSSQDPPVALYDGVDPNLELENQKGALQQFVEKVCEEAALWPGGNRCGTNVPVNTTGQGKDKAAAMVMKPTVVQGDATVDFSGNHAGAGLLIVEGNLYMNGTPSWDGMIIVLGGTIDVSGGGTGAFNGTIYALDMNTSTDPWTLGSDGISWITRGGGTAAYNHNCGLVRDALDLLAEPVYDEDGLPVNARAIFGDNHGCGPAGEGAGTGEDDPRTEYVFRWIEIEN